MYRGTLLLTNTWQQHKGTNYAFCISLKWLNNAVFGKEIDVKFTLTKAYIRLWKRHFRVPRSKFYGVVWLQ